MESKPYDIALIPEERIADEAIKVSQELGKLDTHFVLGTDTYIPHVSLYMLQLKSEDLDKAKILLTNIASSTSVIVGNPTEYHYENDYVDIEYAKSKELESLQNIILETFNPIRDGMREKDKVRLETATGEEKDNLIKYGYRGIGSMFNPHLTFTRFKNSYKEVMDSLPGKGLFEGNFIKIGLFEMGDNGTCIKEVMSINL